MSDLEAKELIVSAKEYYDMRHELCEYRMLAQELGTDLATLSKAIKGIKHRCVYNVEEKRDVFVNTIIFHENDLIIKGYTENSVFPVKEYGKKWALTKEELE